MIDFSKSCYLTGLANREAAVKRPLDALIARLGIHVVGDGYIDAITRLDDVDPFLNQLQRLGIAVTDATLWCDCTPVNIQRFGCPHGYGGPEHANGYFSEMCEADSFDVAALGILAPADESEVGQFVEQCNRMVARYVSVGMKARSDYSPCLVPGFWMAVPEHWKSQQGA